MIIIRPYYDLLAKNFHFDAANNITFFDFDWCGKTYHASDLMTFYVHYFFHVYHGKIDQQEADRTFSVFIQGYREKRSIQDEELKAIPYLGMLFWIFALGFFEDNYDDFSNTFLTPRFLKDRVTLIQRWFEWYCLP